MLLCSYIYTKIDLYNRLIFFTSEARRPGDVQIKVLGGVDEHVKVSVWLKRQKSSSSALTSV